MRKSILSLAVLLALAFVPALHATPITGQFSVIGPSVQDTGTQLIFSPNGINVGAQSTLTGSFLLLAPVLAGSLVSRYDYSVMFIVSAFFVTIATLLMSRVKDVPRR